MIVNANGLTLITKTYFVRISFLQRYAGKNVYFIRLLFTDTSFVFEHEIVSQWYPRNILQDTLAKNVYYIKLPITDTSFVLNTKLVTVEHPRNFLIYCVWLSRFLYIKRVENQGRVYFGIAM